MAWNSIYPAVKNYVNPGETVQAQGFSSAKSTSKTSAFIF